MQTDSRIGGGRIVSEYRHPLLRKITPYFRCLHGLQDPASTRRVRWTPLTVALTATLMALDVGCSLAVRFQDALACLGIERRGLRPAGKTYNGLLKAMVRQASRVLPRLTADLREQAQGRLPYVPRVQGWTLLAVDGSKLDLPRTRGLEKHFGIADNGHVPQALMTVIVEVFTGLLWDWRIDRGRGSEKHHLLDMVGQLPADSMLLADGYYVGYPIWSALHHAGRSFLIRVGGNVNLLRRLWPATAFERRADIVYAWPVHHRRTCPPLRLRLIRVRAGRDCVYVLTNVLDARRLKAKAAGKIYRCRWGVELFYRMLKRTLGHVKVRSRSARRAAVELEWSMIATWIMIMMGVDRLHEQGVACRRLSPAALLQVLRAAMLRGACKSPGRALRELETALGRVIRDNYVRRGAKRSRYRPVTRNTPFPHRLTPPRVRNATPGEQRQARAAYPPCAA